MDDPKRTGWFRNTSSGSVFEAEGEQAAIARKDRDVVELDSPPEGTDENPKLSALRERLSAMGLDYAESDDEAVLISKIDTQASAWRTELEAKGIKNTATWKPETLKRKLDELAKTPEQ